MFVCFVSAKKEFQLCQCRKKEFILSFNANKEFLLFCQCYMRVPFVLSMQKRLFCFVTAIEIVPFGPILLFCQCKKVCQFKKALLFFLIAKNSFILVRPCRPFCLCKEKVLSFWVPKSPIWFVITKKGFVNAKR